MKDAKEKTSRKYQPIIEDNSALNSGLAVTEVAVIPRAEIPAIYEIEHEGETHKLGELRDFHRHPVLKNFVPEFARLSMSWGYLAPGEQLKPHVHPTASMMVICQGSAQMYGQTKELIAGDVVVVPPGCAHGFIGGPNGMAALSIQFGKEGGLYENTKKPLVQFCEKFSTHHKLITFNQKCLEKFKQRPLFDMLRSETLKDPERRARYLAYMKIWTDHAQTLLYTRQATTLDPRFRGIFAKHMQEEVGHDELYNGGTTKASGAAIVERKDSIILSVTTWFLHQMICGDNVEKAAIVHLVIENASDYYHQTAREYLARYIGDEYFKEHEVDGEHAALAEILLKNQHEETYQRLHEVIDDAWHMLYAFVDRMHVLVTA